VPIFDPNGKRLKLKADAGGPAVGRDSRVLLADGGVIWNVFCIGLGADYKPWGPMGGEPSFDGQANSLWLYQNDIGGVVYQGVRQYLEAVRSLKARYAGSPERALPAGAALEAGLEVGLSLYAARP